MTSAKITAYRFRRLIFIIGSLFTIAGVAWVILPFFNDFFEERIDFVFYGLMGTVLAPFKAVSESEPGYAQTGPSVGRGLKWSPGEWRPRAGDPRGCRSSGQGRF